MTSIAGVVADQFDDGETFADGVEKGPVFLFRLGQSRLGGGPQRRLAAAVDRGPGALENLLGEPRLARGETARRRVRRHQDTKWAAVGPPQGRRQEGADTQGGQLRRGGAAQSAGFGGGVVHHQGRLGDQLEAPRQQRRPPRRGPGHQPRPCVLAHEGGQIGGEVELDQAAALDPQFFTQRTDRQLGRGRRVLRRPKSVAESAQQGPLPFAFALPTNGVRGRVGFAPLSGSPGLELGLHVRRIHVAAP